MGTLAVDQFTQPPAIAEFIAFQNDVSTTAEAHGLHKPDRTGFYPLILGSGSLAAQGLDSRVLKPGERSDLDVVVSMNTFQRLTEAGVLRGASRLTEHTHMGWIHRSREAPLSVEVFASEDPLGYVGVGNHGEAYRGAPNSSTLQIEKLHVLRATAVAADKLRLEPRVKDAAGIIKAQVVAASMEHPIVEDEAWQAMVAKAIGKIMSNSVDMTLAPLWRRALHLPKYPSWLTQLKRAQFEHPAFQKTPFDTKRAA